MLLSVPDLPLLDFASLFNRVTVLWTDFNSGSQVSFVTVDPVLSYQVHVHVNPRCSRVCPSGTLTGWVVLPERCKTLGGITTGELLSHLDMITYVIGDRYHVVNVTSTRFNSTQDVHLTCDPRVVNIVFSFFIELLTDII